MSAAPNPDPLPPSQPGSRTPGAGSNQSQPALAKCPDCLGFGGCLLGLPALFEMPEQKCSATGLWRTRLYKLTSPTEDNGFHPPVESFEERNEGARTGHRMILGASLCRHIRNHKTKPSSQNSAKKKKKSRSANKNVASNKTPKPVTTPTPPPPADPPAPTATSAVANNTPPPPPPPPPEDDNPSPEAQS